MADCSSSDSSDCSETDVSSESETDFSDSEGFVTSGLSESSASSQSSVSSDSEDENIEHLNKRKCPRQPYKTSVRNHFKVFALNTKTAQFDYSKTLMDIKEDALDVLQGLETPSYKFCLTANCNFKREIEQSDTRIINHWFRTSQRLKINDHILAELVESAVIDLESQIENFIKLGSGKCF
jgi:hypothetical protein